MARRRNRRRDDDRRVAQPTSSTAGYSGPQRGVPPYKPRPSVALALRAAAPSTRSHASKASAHASARPAQVLKPRDEARALDRRSMAYEPYDSASAVQYSNYWAKQREGRSNPVKESRRVTPTLAQPDQAHLQSKGVSLDPAGQREVVSGDNCRAENRPQSNRGNGGSRPFVPWCQTGRSKK